MHAANIVGDRGLPARYRVAGRLGTGASGDVFLAHDRDRGDRCAIKLCADGGETATARLLVEFSRLSELAHPSLVPVRDLGRSRHGRPFLVTDLVDGPPLDAVADAENFARAAHELADAVAYLHDRGLVHGDISPANVRLDTQGRAVLLDFGLSVTSENARSAGASGTLGFMAPEALIGERGPAADLFALGATLYTAWTGEPPFGTGLAAVRRMGEGPAPAPSTLRPGLPASWDAMVLRLMAVDVEARPASARELLREIRRQMTGTPPEPAVDLGAPQPGGDPLAGAFVGRRVERDALTRLLERLAEGQAPVNVVAVCGASGAGRRALIDRVVRDARVAQVVGVWPELDIEAHTLVSLSHAPHVGESDDPARGRQARLAVMIDALEARSVARPLCIVLPPGDDEEALAAALAGTEPNGRLLVVLPTSRPLAAGEMIRIEPLAAAEIRELVARIEPVPAPVRDRIARASGGHAATVVLLIRQWLQALRDGRTEVDFLAEPDATLDRLLDESFRALGANTQRFVVALPWAELADLDPAAEAEARDRARAAGWLEGAALASEAHREAALRGLHLPSLRDLAASLARAMHAQDPGRGEAWLAAGEDAAAAAAFREAARAAYASGRMGQAARCWLRASGDLPLDERLDLAGALGVIGRHDEALAVLDGAPAPVVAERRAWILGRRGDLAGARATLEDAGTAAMVRARLARILVSLGELEEAARVAGEVPDGPAEPLAREAAVLAAALGGRMDDAERLLGDVSATDARGAYLRAYCRQLAGRPAEAAVEYERALALEGDPHVAAAATFNLGCVLAEAGRFEEAIAAFDRAIRALGRLGAGSDLALALFNAGVLFVQLGDLEAAERALARVRVQQASPLLEGCVAALEGDITRRRGDPGRAAPLYARASLAFRRAGMHPLAVAADLACAEIGDGAAVEPSDDASTLTCARLALGAPAGAGDTKLAERLQQLATRTALAGRRVIAWRAASLARRLFARLADTRAEGALADARRLFEEVKMLTPVHHRPGLDADPDAPTPIRSAEALSTSATGRLRRFLRINKRLNSELRLSRVLETIIDTVIELTDAERGFLLLKDAAGELQVRVARNIDQTTLDGPALAVSRSIAKQAADRGEPVITVDAAGDDRFREALSVSDLRLRSVLAVPLAVKGAVVGTIYVDHRLRRGAFGEEDVALILDFAEQGAIAIENARLVAELRRRERQIEMLNRRLERDLRARGDELVEVRQELKETRDAAALRHDYKQIVGRSPRMMELLRQLDRVTDTALPVVIQGESGTGKELVARAIHFNGARRLRPFVTENCAAIPETLLESTLFGYAKGAFTGADRDTRGLFAVADGGTLFLDEVAEMSPGMQGKLLRVLQDGEFRRVGGEKAQHADVRVVVATNKDLGRLVEQGKFRQDLFYRLNVVRLTLPPLRERREDVPLLVAHFLERSGKRIMPPALARLAAYRWPGNVRELENEVTRAAALSGAQIEIADLSPHVATGDPAAVEDAGPDSLLLKPRVERLERTLIHEALARHEGNQTRAAVALGLSRFGLQKKLQRYRMGGTR